MPLPYYVSPEQMMKDKAEYARKGISRGRSIVTLEIRDGILLVAENPSTLLHKVSEIYDRIAFAGVGPGPAGRRGRQRPRRPPPGPRTHFLGKKKGAVRGGAGKKAPHLGREK